MTNKLSLLLVLGLTASSTLTAGYTAEQVKKAQTGTAIASSIALPLAIFLEPKVSKPGAAAFRHVGECMARATESNHPLQNIANVALVAGTSGRHAYTRSKLFKPLLDGLTQELNQEIARKPEKATKAEVTTYLQYYHKGFDSVIISGLVSDIVTAALNETTSALCLHVSQKCKGRFLRRIIRAATLTLSKTAFSALVEIAFQGLPTLATPEINKERAGFTEMLKESTSDAAAFGLIPTSDINKAMENILKIAEGKEGFEQMSADIIKTDFDALWKNILKSLAVNAVEQAAYEVVGELIQRSADDAHAAEWLEQEKTKMGVGAEAAGA